MMSENEGYSVGRENPRYGSYSLSLFPRASKYKLEGQEDRLSGDRARYRRKKQGHKRSLAMERLLL